jgi:hypothetical protein
MGNDLPGCTPEAVAQRQAGPLVAQIARQDEIDVLFI